MNSKKAYTFLVFLLLISFNVINAQPFDSLYTYKEIKWLNDPPLWLHVTRDTSIPGKNDTMPDIYFNGYTNLGLEKTVFAGDFVYNIYSNPNERYYGSYIEKVNLKTGRLAASIVYDRRHDPEAYSNSCQNAYITEDGDLEVLVTTRYELSSFFDWTPPRFGTLVIDTATLQLKSFVHGSKMDTSSIFIDNRVPGTESLILPSTVDNLYYYYHNAHIKNFKGNDTIYSIGVRLNKIDKNGYLLKDTFLYQFDYRRSNKLKKFKNRFYDQIYTIGSDTLVFMEHAHYEKDDSIYARIFYTDRELNLWGSYDLSPYFDTTLTLEEFKVDRHNLYIRFKKKYPRSDFFYYYDVFYILDHKGHLLERVKAVDENGEKIYLPGVYRIPGVEGTVFTDANYRDSTLTIWQTDGHGVLRRIKDIYFSPKNYMFNIADMMPLEDGTFYVTGRLRRDTIYRGRRWAPAYAKACGRFTREGLGLKGTGTQSPSALEEKSMELLPNPAHGKFRIVFTEPFAGVIRIFDEQGKRKFRLKKKGEQQILIDCKAWQAGVYFIQPISESGEVYKGHSIVVQ